MAANEDPKDIAATDKAYQAATEAVNVPSATPVKSAGDVKAPDSAKSVDAKSVDAKSVEGAQAAKAPATPVTTKAVYKVTKAKLPATPKAPVVRKPAVAAKAVAAKPVAEAKPKPIENVIPVKAATPKPAVEVVGEKSQPVPPVAKPAAAISKAAKTASQYAFAGFFTPFMLEDKTMNMSTNFSGFQDTITEAQAKAKEVFEKSTKMLGEVGDFTKGNVEAVIESGKILAEGVQSLGSELAAEGRSAFEIMTGDIKELAAAKSPTDFFKIQSDMMRKNFDSAVAYGSKNSEAMLKLVSDVMAPISGRVSIAMEKARSVSV